MNWIITFFLRSRINLLLFFVFLGGITIRLFVWDASPYLSRDSIFYLEQINRLYHDAESNFNSLETPYPPMLFYMTKTIMKAGASGLYAGLSINIIMGALIPVISFFLSKEFLGSKVISAISTLIVFFHPSLIRLSLEIQRDIGYIFISTVLLLFLIRGIKRALIRYWILTGFFFVISIMFRAESFEFLPIIICFSFVVFARKRKMKRWGIMITAFVLSFIVSGFITMNVLKIDWNYILKVSSMYSNRIDFKDVM